MSSWRKGLSNTKICGKSIPGRKLSICQGPVVGNELGTFREKVSRPAGLEWSNHGRGGKRWGGKVGWGLSARVLSLDFILSAMRSHRGVTSKGWHNLTLKKNFIGWFTKRPGRKLKQHSRREVTVTDLRSIRGGGERWLDLKYLWWWNSQDLMTDWMITADIRNKEQILIWALKVMSMTLRIVDVGLPLGCFSRGQL